MSTPSLSTVAIAENTILPDSPILLHKYTAFTGCNPYYRSSVVRQMITFSKQVSANTKIVDKRFNERFFQRFLGLDSFHPRNGLDKRFLRKLDTNQGATLGVFYLQSIIAVETTTAFARHALNAVPFAGIKTFSNHSDLIWASETPRLSRDIAKVALVGIVELLPDVYQAYNQEKDVGFLESLNTLLDKVRRSKLAASTAVIRHAAIRRRIPCQLVGQQHLIIGQGNKQKYLYASMTSTTPVTAQKICIDKRQTNRRLKELRLPVPRHYRVGTIENAKKAAESLGFPVIVKPVRGQKGRDISDRISSLEDIVSAFDNAHRSGSDVLIEQYIEGDDYRLLVIDGKFHSAVHRKAPTIIGDGVSTVSKLVEQLNQDPYRDRFRGFPIAIDNEITSRLEDAGLSLDDVPEQGRELVLRMRANVSTGGTPSDVTDLVHPEIRAMAVRAAKAVQLTIAGIDYLTTDIESSPSDTHGVIIEINARPGLDIHTWPHTGKSHDAGGALVEHLFPGGDNGRIPIVAAAGDYGTGVSARIVDALLRGTGSRVALTLNSECYSDGKESVLTSKQQAKAPLVMLRDPEIDSLVTTISLRQTAIRGMLIDHCDVAMILDRIKPGGVKAFLSGLEVIVQATTGCFVVGAGNLVALKQIQTYSKNAKLIIVSARQEDPAFQAHLNAGYIGVTSMWLDDYLHIVILSGDSLHASFSLKNMQGIKNIGSKGVSDAMLFAVGAVYGQGISVPEISNAINLLPDLITRPSAKIQRYATS
jgi:cyanophycin synthetase